MLVLTRRLGEKLIIGDEIKFQVLEISGNQVRIGIDAPKSVNIVREEIIGTPRGKKLTDPAPSESSVESPASKRPRLGLYGRGNRNDRG